MFKPSTPRISRPFFDELPKETKLQIRNYLELKLKETNYKLTIGIFDNLEKKFNLTRNQTVEIYNILFEPEVIFFFKFEKI